MMRAFLKMLIPVFAMTVYCYCIFLFISFIGADVAMDYNYFAVLACSILACVINYRFSLREQNFAKVAVVNAVLIVLTAIVGFSTFNEIEGILLHFIAAILFAVPVAGSFLLYRSPIRANTMLVFCELSVVGTAGFVGLQLGLFEAPGRAFFLSTICLALNLFLLSSMRTDAQANRKVDVKKQIEKGMILTVIIVCSVFAAVSVVIFGLPLVRGALFGMFAGIGKFFTFLGSALESFFVWLAEIMPDPQPMDIEAIPTESSPMPDENIQEFIAQISDSAIIAILSIIVAVIVCVAVIAIIKLRKNRLRIRMQTLQVTRDDVEEGDGLLIVIASMLRRIFGRVILLYWILSRRNTYEGFFVLLSRIAGRKGFARASSETVGAYLSRLTPVLTSAYEEMCDTTQDFSWIANYLIGVRGQIDCLLYAPVATYTELNDRDIASRILSVARKIKKQA